MSTLDKTLPSSVTPASALQINLLEALEILHKHITQVLCNAVFQSARNRERQRKWSLYVLARFWMTVILNAPASLTQRLEEVRLGKNVLVPWVESSFVSFFKKCKTTHFRFFMVLYQTFTQNVVPEAPTVYVPQTHKLLKHFSGIWAVDGSRLDEIAHRCKMLWNEASVVLPGCVLVFYDLIRGITRQVLFDPDAAKAELTRAESLLDLIPVNTLILGDRLYASIRLFWELTEKKLWGLFRLNHRLKVKKNRLICRRQGGGRTTIEEWLVTVGCGQGQTPITLRLILLRHGKVRRELLTNALDSRALSAKDALGLYPLRWRIERVFFDLKEVLRLNSFYAANANAVAMQVYATAMVHTAFRIAQAKIAQKNGISPEDISSAKLFVCLAVASVGWIGGELYYNDMVRTNRGMRLKKPNWKNSSFAHTSLRSVLIEVRNPERRVLPPRTPMRWKSLAHVKGVKLS
jgi:hypothetical protein